MRSDATPAGQHDLTAIGGGVRGRIVGLLAERPTLENKEVRDILRRLGENTSMPDDAMSRLITDAVMCEHDLRMALDDPGARDDVAVKVALNELAGRFSDRVAAAGLPSLRVTVEQWGTIAGDGPASACVVADRFEFVRAMAGRRSASEIRRWNWSGDPEPYLDVIAETELPDEEVHERDPRVPEHMRDREFKL